MKMKVVILVSLLLADFTILLAHTTSRGFRDNKISIQQQHHNENESSNKHGQLIKHHHSQHQSKSAFSKDALTCMLPMNSYLALVKPRIPSYTSVANSKHMSMDFIHVFQHFFKIPVMTSIPIPQIIHRFWTGTKMGDVSFNNILETQERVSGTKWTQIVWTVNDINDAFDDVQLQKQIEIMKAKGVEVYDVISDLVPHVEGGDIGSDYTEGTVTSVFHQWVVGAKASALKGNFNNVKYLSDLSRLAMTYVYGGVYMDVDIGIGDVDLDHSQLYHRDRLGEVPLAGVQCQVPEQYERLKAGHCPSALWKLNVFEKTCHEADHDHSHSTFAPYFNYFHAIRPGADVNKEALLSMLMTTVEKTNGGMTAADILFKYCVDPRQWLIEWVMDLQWTTEASSTAEGF